MENLTEAEKDEISRMLNTLDPAHVNLMALDRKYQIGWYKEQIEHLDEMDQYFREVAEVMRLADKNDAARTLDEQRSKILMMKQMFGNAVEDLEEVDKNSDEYRYYLG